ncbi:MAG TPA: LCP family protein [Candidatus Limnocylindria bacterium]
MSDGVPTATVHARSRRPWLAALLSFVVPGLGQAYEGRWRLALTLAIPIVALALVVIGATSGLLTGVRSALFAPQVLAGILVINGIVLLWRGFAIADAGLAPWNVLSGQERRVALLSVSGLMVVTLAMHLWVGGVIVQLERTLAQVFSVDDGEAGAVPVAQPSRAATSSEPRPTATPEPDPVWNGDDRVNILLLGTDAAPGRDDALTDVVLVISAHPATHSAVMISVPRDTAGLPLPDRSVYADGLYPGRVNSILDRAAEHADAWCPDLDPTEQAAACGLRAIETTIGLYLGIQIHHHAIVDMAGFADVIDAIGGVELCLPGRLVDPEFDSAIADRYEDGLVLPAGCHRYDGLDALAYARSRKGWIEMPDGSVVGQSDFDRAERQQRVLLAMRAELQNADTLLELPGLLSALGRTISTDVERSQASGLAALLPLITGPDIERVVLGYPEFVDVPSDAAANYRLIPRRDAIRERMAEIFGASELQGWYLASDDEGPDTPQAGASAAPAP